MDVGANEVSAVIVEIPSKTVVVEVVVVVVVLLECGTVEYFVMVRVNYSNRQLQKSVKSQARAMVLSCLTFHQAVSQLPGDEGTGRPSLPTKSSIAEASSLTVAVPCRYELQNEEAVEQARKSLTTTGYLEQG